MSEPITIGMARMHAEFGERRDFLPPFVARLIRRGAKIILEHGYGSGMGFTEEDYRIAAPDVQFAAHAEIYRQACVLVLRCPIESELKLLNKGATLTSMLHYPTRPQRVDLLRSLGVEGISLDSLKDDNGRRLVESEVRRMERVGSRLPSSQAHLSCPGYGRKKSQSNSSNRIGSRRG